VCRADNLTTADYLDKMWELRCLTTLSTFMASYRDSFTLFTFCIFLVIFDDCSFIVFNLRYVWIVVCHNF
jgi:hypothetical protein